MKMGARVVARWALFIASVTGPAVAGPTPATWNVRDAGAAGNGTNDDTAVFQRVLDEAGREGGGTVLVPAGRYAIRGNLAVPAGVTLQGTFRVPPTPQRNAAREPAGSVLLAYAGRGQEKGPPFVRLAGPNAVLSGMVILYPEWKQTDVPPVPYPPCVAVEHVEDAGIENCLLLNPYEAIRLVYAARHVVRNVTGYPIRRGIYVDACMDIGRIENVHFWPFGVHYKPDDPYCRWINTEGVAFEFARTDWHYVLNTFCFGYGIGYRFSASEHGSANGNFLGLGADSCQRAVVVDQAQAPGLLISNGEFVGRWGSRDAVTLDIGPDAEGKVSLSNCSFWGPIDRCVWMRGTNGQFTASACHFVNWDIGGAGSPAIQVDAGRAIVQGCTFENEGPHVRVGAAVRSALLVGNQASGGFAVDNAAGPRTKLAANEDPPFEWTDEARRHYRVAVGMAGDGPYLRHWHGREAGSPDGAHPPTRWSTPQSEMWLPVEAGVPYTLTMKANIPAAGLGPDAGFYVGGQKIAAIDGSTGTLTAELPPAQGDRIVVRVVCAGWVPAKVNAASTDDRVLGLQASEILMRAKGAGERVFDANTGAWR